MYNCILFWKAVQKAGRCGPHFESEKVEGYVQGLTLLNDSVSLYSPLWQHWTHWTT